MRMNIDKRNDVIMYIVLGLFTIATGYYSLGEGFELDAYLGLSGGDGVFGLALIKSIQENGIFGIYFNNRIGAPDVSSLIDYPVLDVFMAFVIWVISWFTKSTPNIMYIYYMLTFPMNAIALAVLLRKINIKRSVAFTMGSIFTFVPFHFLRGMGHSTLINYMFFSFAVYLSLYIMGFFENERKWKVVVAAVLLGLGYGYYYAFGLIIIAIAIIIRLGKDTDIKKNVSCIWVPLITLASIFGTLLPKIAYALMNGSNKEVGIRQYIEQEIYGLKIIQLFLPPSYSRISAFRQLSADYASKAPLVNENTTASLGFIACLGFIVLCVGMIYSFVVKDKCNTKSWLLIDYLSLSTVALVLMGAVGGFGEIFNMLITSQIRCYNRSSIYIAGLAIMMVAILLNEIKIKNIWISWIICISILGVSMFDTVYKSATNWQAGIKTTQKYYEEFFDKIENTLGEGTMIYQLPYWDFPEAGTFDYKHFIGYLFTDTLKWSYGGVKGRNTGAKNLLDGDGKSYVFLRNIKEAGFEAVYIDVSGYDDGGASILEFYNNLGIEPIVSYDGILYLYDISDIEIASAKLQVGYLFVEKWNNDYEMNLTEDEISNLAVEVEKQNTETYEKLFVAIKDPDIASMSDNEYIDFLYTSILGRTESEDERMSWLNTLHAGKTREDVFNAFLDSLEFRSNQGYREAE